VIKKCLPHFLAKTVKYMWHLFRAGPPGLRLSTGLERLPVDGCTDGIRLAIRQPGIEVRVRFKENSGSDAHQDT
jgi:hypothetical protein